VQEVGTAYLDIDGEGHSPAVASELDAVGLHIADIAEVADLEQAWNGSSCSVAEVSSSASQKIFFLSHWLAEIENHHQLPEVGVEAYHIDFVDERLASRQWIDRLLAVSVEEEVV
jgi:hypothetical protein